MTPIALTRAVPLVSERCGGCSWCERACPAGAIRWREALGLARILVDDALCDACGACESACRRGALRLGPPPESAPPAPGSLRVAAEVGLRYCIACGSVFGSAGAVACHVCTSRGAA